LRALSGVEREAQQLAISKTGTLWLLDYADGVTVKVSSVHCGEVQQAQVLPGTAPLLLTCGDDGCAKLTDLANLEQPCEVYKPRR
jgi:streptogramin lyase